MSPPCDPQLALAKALSVGLAVLRALADWADANCPAAGLIRGRARGA